jgi:putative FmdB family regulatory protein
MPTYEYACKTCGQSVEVFQSFSDKPLKKHKECGGDLQKVFHARGIVFKGGGFYATDSKSASSSKKSGESSSGEKSEKSEKSERSEKAADKSSKGDTGDKKTSAKAAVSTKSSGGDD